MDLALRHFANRGGHGALEDDEVRCSGVPRANTASLSGHGSTKPRKQESHLQIAHRHTETTVRSGAENRIGLSVVVSLREFGEETDAGSIAIPYHVGNEAMRRRPAWFTRQDRVALPEAPHV